MKNILDDINNHNKNELTDINGKINNNKKELEKNKGYFLKVKL